MLVRVRSGRSGIVEYLEKGRKQGREFERDQIDTRLALSGDLELLRTFLNTPGAPRCEPSRYLHITLGFAERFSMLERGPGEIDEATIREVDRLFREKLLVAYHPDEYLYYSETHVPRVTHELQSDGSMVERLPHIHIVIPMRSLVDGRYLNPLGYGTANIKYLDAIQESINRSLKLLSPKDSPRVMGKDPLERHTGIRRPVQEQIRDAVERGIVRNFEELEDFAQTLGAVRVRRGATDDYLNVLPSGAARGINLKSLGRNYFALHKTRPVGDKHELEWRNRAAFEARHITSGNREAYWKLDDSGREAMLIRLRDRARARVRAMALEGIDLGIPESVGPRPLRSREGPESLASAAEKSAETASTRQIANRTDTGTLRGKHLDPVPGRERDRQPTSALEGMLRGMPTPPTPDQLKRDTNPILVLDYASEQLGIEREAYALASGSDGSPRILHQGKQYNLGDFLTKHLKLEWSEARRILEGCWYATQAESLPKATPSLWRAFELQRQARAERSRVQRMLVRKAWGKERSRIRDRYRGRVGRGKTTHIERALARAERVASEEQSRNHARLELHALRRRPRAEAYREFLRESAQAGDLRALSELRRVRVSAVVPDGDWISGAGTDRPSFFLPDYRVDASGSVSYWLKGQLAVVDAPRVVRVLQGGPESYETALRLAVVRYGQHLNLHGDQKFRRGIVDAAKRTGLQVSIGIEGIPALGIQRIQSMSKREPRMNGL